MDTMRAKLELARGLREQSQALSAFEYQHWADLSEVQRYKLGRAIQKLNSRAAELLHDALEEGAERAEELIDVIQENTNEILDAVANVDKIDRVLKIASQVAKAASAVISGGITSGLGVLA